MICALCDTEVGGNFSREHVFAEWMRKLFLIEEKRITYRRGFQGREEPWDAQEWEDAPFNLRVKDLCKPCNNEWCEGIETEAKPIMTPMIRGQAVKLDASAQTSLAVWATKTLLMLHLAYPKEYRSIPREQFWWFRKNRWPLTNEQIWIAQYDGCGDWPTTTHHYGIKLYDPAVSEPGDDMNGHAAAIAVGHLVFRAFGHTLDTGTVAAPGEPFHGTLRQIWPATGDTIDFPPPTIIKGNDGLRTLVDAFGDASAFPRP